MVGKASVSLNRCNYKVKMKFSLVIITIMVGLVGLSRAIICGVDDNRKGTSEYHRNFEDERHMEEYNRDYGYGKH